ncbi:MAG: metallophosphoesterase [Burkholderiaceae bacterium]|nr:metallophosphoesterase [Burkholderiaceae bacterium]
MNMLNLKKTLSALTLTLATSVLLTLGGCGGDSSPAPATSAKFAVMSDVHTYDVATLGGVTNGTVTSPEFAAYIASDRKMIVDATEILDSVIADLKAKKPEFLLISGDLTKDGEKANHQLLASKLAALRANGTKVFVVPGNHDVNNPDAVSFKTSPATKTATVTPDEFKTIYADYGYNSAIYKDTNSLSYIAEPVPGVWLFAIDSCQYEQNIANGKPTTAGAIKAATQAWILDRLAAAKQQNKKVIGMMHHGILEHYTGQATLFSEYVVKDYATVSKSLSDAGLQVMFTGHYHANDITRKDFGTSVLHDIETGSLVTAPSPYRLIDFDIVNSKLAITTSTVKATASHPSDFVAYSSKFLSDGMTALAPYILKGMGLTDAQITALTQMGAVQVIVNGFVAHYAGDEKPDATATAVYTAMMQSSDAATKSLGQAIASIWTDLAPGDNNVTITINSTK